MTDPRMNEAPEFAAFLHSRWYIPTTEHKAAMMALDRRGPLFEEYDFLEDAREMITGSFREDENMGSLEDTGLRSRFEQLARSVRCYKPYGMSVMIAMAYSDRNEDLTEYQPENKESTILTLVGVAQRLLEEYFEASEIKELCEQVPIYEGVLRNLRTGRERRGGRTPRRTALHCSH